MSGRKWWNGNQEANKGTSSGEHSGLHRCLLRYYACVGLHGFMSCHYACMGLHAAGCWLSSTATVQSAVTLQKAAQRIAYASDHGYSVQYSCRRQQAVVEGEDDGDSLTLAVATAAGVLYQYKVEGLTSTSPKYYREGEWMVSTPN